MQASGVAPVVVLTKADIAAADPRCRAHVAQMGGARRHRGRRVDGTAPAPRAARSRTSLGPARRWSCWARGAGKSTLTNTLLGAAVQDTGAVREHDGRGKHTTTSRTLHRLPGGACLIDTPGLRTLWPDVDEATLLGELPRHRRRCACVPLPRLRATATSPAARCARQRRRAARNYQKLLREPGATR